MKKLVGYTTHVALCLALAACGGGGGGGGGSSTATVASISGSVIDGYIEGATVCLDLNANQACDSSEPSATTNASGAFTLNTSSLTIAQVRAAHLLVVVPSNAKDLDDGGQTIAAAGKKPFWLLAPASTYVSTGGTVSGSAVVNPFTTMVSHVMLTNPGTAIDDARNAVKTQLGLSSSIDLHQNFVSTPNASLQGKARTIAYLIGKLSDGATSIGTATERERILAALHYVRNNAATVQSIVDADSVNSTVPSKVDAAIGTSGLSPNYTNLVSQAKEITAVETTNYATILGSGVYINTCLLSPSCSTALYGKLSLQSNQATLNYLIESAGTWAAYTPNVTMRRLTSNGWEVPQFSSTFTYTAIDSQTAESVGPWGGVSSIGTLGVMDLSNKTSADIPGGWSKSGANLKSVTFPTGSKVYIARGAPTADQYTLWTDYPYTSGPSGSRATDSSFTNLVDLIAAHQTTGATNTSKHLSWSDIIVTFDSYATSGTATLWNDANYPCVRTVNGYSCGGGSPSFTKIGTVQYEVRTVSGTSILVIFAQSSVDEAGYPIYSVRGGTVYRGIFTPKGHPTNSSLYFNRTAFDAILAAWSKPSVPN